MAKTKAKIRKYKKLSLVFNEDERREYLTGFQRRKSDRKQRAKERLISEYKEAKSMIRKNKRDALKKYYLGNNDPNVELLLKPVSYNLPEHEVVVSSLDTQEIGGLLGVSMGNNRFSMLKNDNADQREAVDFIQTSMEEDDGRVDIRGDIERGEDFANNMFTPKELKKQQDTELKANKAFQLLQRIKNKESSKKNNSGMKKNQRKFAMKKSKAKKGKKKKGRR